MTTAGVTAPRRRRRRGLIGTATAWRLAQAGWRFAVAGERAAAASRVAAGMLAPVTETTFTEQALLALNRASREPLRRLRRRGGGRVRAARRAAPDADPLGRLRRRRRRPVADVRRLPRPDRPPGAAPDQPRVPELRAAAGAGVRSGLLVPDDWSCDNRLLLAALVTAAGRAGVVERDRLRAPRAEHGRSGHRGRAGRRQHGSPRAVSCWRTAPGPPSSTGVPALPVRPVKGQILRLDPGRFPGPSRHRARVQPRLGGLPGAPRAGRRGGRRRDRRGAGLRPPRDRRRRLRAAPRRPPAASR